MTCSKKTTYFISFDFHRTALHSIKFAVWYIFLMNGKIITDVTFWNRGSCYKSMHKVIFERHIWDFLKIKKISIWCKIIKDSTMCRYACRSINNNNKWVKIERILYRINEVQTQQKIINHPFSTPHRTSTFMNKRAAYGWCRIIHDKLMPQHFECNVHLSTNAYILIIKRGLSLIHLSLIAVEWHRGTLKQKNWHQHVNYFLSPFDPTDICRLLFWPQHYYHMLFLFLIIGTCYLEI